MGDKGLFITIEGIDGAGKGTQIQYLVELMEARGLHPLLIREPGGTPIGEQIREILLGAGNPEMTAETELLLFAAARAQLVREVIRPALAKGQLVLCDRFFDSTLAYQAGGRGLDRGLVEQSILLATGGLEPDLTLYLDLDPEKAAGRRENREDLTGSTADRIERETADFNRRVREQYLALAEEAKRIVTIDAAKAPAEVRADIKEVILPLI